MPINISFYLKTEQKIRGAASLSLQRGNVTNVFLPSCAISLRVTLILFTHSHQCVGVVAPHPPKEEEEEEEGWKQVCFQGVATKTKESAAETLKDADECVCIIQSVQVNLFTAQI